MEAQREEKKDVSGKEGKYSLKNPDFRNMLVVGIVVLVIAVGIVWKKGYLGGFSGAKTLSQEQIKERVEAFIKENLVQEGTEVEIKSAIKENGLYKIELTVQGQEIVTYATVDGKKFFTQAIDMEKGIEKPQEEPDQPIVKNDKPVVDLYVMSFCPFGNKAEDTLKPVYDLLKNKVAFNFHYIVNSSGDTINSLHGQPEVDQNMREACVERDYGKDKWFSFVSYVNKNCGEKGECWEAGANSLGISVAKVNACVKADGVALMKTSEKASTEAGAQGSPTMKINGVNTKVVYQYGNSEEYKKVICSAFNTAPAECEKVLAANTDTAAGASCH